MASQILEGADAQAGSRKLLRSPGFAEEVLNIIRADIMSLRIPPETRISIDRLARELGVSQTPIREALSMLEAMGLVTRRHCVGYCSAPQLNRKRLDELHEMRLLLEPYAARRAAQSMSETMAATLRQLSRALAPQKSGEPHDRFAQLDSDLHEAIAAGCDNDVIRKSLSRIHAHFHIFGLRFASEATGEVHLEHDRLVDALIRGDADGAEQAMRVHVQNAYERLLPFARA